MSRPGAPSLPHHTDTLFSVLTLGVGPPHLSQRTDAEVDVLRGTNAVVRQKQSGEEDTVSDLEGVVLEKGGAKMLFDERTDCANQAVTSGLSDGVQALNDSAVIVTGSFERTVGDNAELVKSLLESFSNDVV